MLSSSKIMFVVFALFMQSALVTLATPVEPSPAPQISVACSNFVKACYQIAAPDANVKYVCRKEPVRDSKGRPIIGGGRNSSQFTFGCTINGQESTKKALKQLAARRSGDSPASSLTTETVSATSTATVTSTSTVTATTTQTAAVQRRASQAGVDSTRFCQSYADSCDRQCAKKSLTPSEVTCHQNARTKKHSLTFTLVCTCPPGVNQHALAHIGEIEASATTYTTLPDTTTTTAVTSTQTVTVTTTPV